VVGDKRACAAWALVALLAFCCRPASAEEVREPLPLIGVNFAGASFGAEKLPGRVGWDYFYPNIEAIAYFAGKGANVIRLCVLWERLQPQLRSDLNESEMKLIDGVIADAHSKGVRVLLDVHNYAAFAGSRIGTDRVSVQDFADLWQRLAVRYRNDRGVIFGLMNEPVQLPTETWLAATNAAIEAIRTAGADNVIMVPGNGWSSARDWFSSSYGSPNATVMRRTSDPRNNFAYEVHQYFDPDGSGTHPTCIDEVSATATIAAFTEWARKNGRKAFLGEFGVGSDPNCLDVLRRVLQFMQDNRDVWIGWTYWAAGPSWPRDYFTNIEPDGRVDRPQMTVLEKFMAHPTSQSN
jgi:endoglucanase